MDSLSDRQQNILNKARLNGRVEVELLANQFSVSPQTIRKDLNILCSRQLLQRIHGGAVITSSIENLSYEARRVLAPEAKQQIGALAAKTIPNNSSILINIGTTTEQVAKHLHNHKGLLVISNNINTANIMRSFSGCDVIIAGGLVRQSDGGIIGGAAVEFINQFKADFAVIGVSAIDQDGSLLDYDLREVHVAQAIIKNARHVILVADHMKFERSAPIRLGHLSQIDTFVTDLPLSKELTALCQEHGVKIVHPTAISPKL